MDLFDQVMHALEGEDPPRTWDGGPRGKIIVTRASFVEWAHRIERTNTPTALECVALIKFKISDFDPSAERRIVEGWSRALRAAASAGSVVPRDPVTLLPLQKVPDAWDEWGVTLADADRFVGGLGMPWTVTAIAEHMLQEANIALAMEHEQVAGGREIIPKTPAPASTRLDWKQIARVYATEAWDSRREGSNPSKAMIAETVRKRFLAEVVRGPRGPLSKETILRDALNTWRKPTEPGKAPGTP